MEVLNVENRVTRRGSPDWFSGTVWLDGDSIFIEPGERHWHGAAPQHGMVHLAIQEASVDGIDATWLEHVANSDYDQA
jgi:hypothetical protein